MSHITDILLITCIEEASVQEVQKWIEHKRNTSLVEISKNAGGNKVMGCEIWAAAIKDFDAKEFVDFVASIKWEFPECVQLFIKDNDDDGFTQRGFFNLNKNQ